MAENGGEWRRMAENVARKIGTVIAFGAIGTQFVALMTGHTVLLPLILGPVVVGCCLIAVSEGHLRPRR